MPTAVWATVRWIRTRDHGTGAALLLALALWLPWTLQDRPMFMFYMTPVVPFVVLLQGLLLARLARSGRVGAVISGLIVALAVTLLVFHWPILTATPITQEAWALRVSEWSKIPLWRPQWL